MKNKYRIMVTAAAVCILATASTTVYASRASVETANQNNVVTETTSDTKTPTISLQSISDSDQSKAETEWMDYYNKYVQEHDVSNDPTGLDAKYEEYGAFTQEMADKLDEIVSRYKLTLHAPCNSDMTNDEMIQFVATGNFLGTANTNNGGYVYEDGTIHFDGNATIDSGLKIDYQFMNNKKGTLNTSMQYLIDEGIYDKEWSYTASCGTDVCLAIGQERSIIIADLGDSILTINVLAGTKNGSITDENGRVRTGEEGKVTTADLEALVNTFDFSLIK